MSARCQQFTFEDDKSGLRLTRIVDFPLEPGPVEKGDNKLSVSGLAI